MSTILAAAREDGYPVLLDGTNASDEAGDRPGMRALSELGVLSPLRLCGLTKPEIRRLSKVAGLFTWSKPAYACLATRVKTGEPIRPETLRAVEESEDFLFSLGFRISGCGRRKGRPCCSSRRGSCRLRMNMKNRSAGGWSRCLRSFGSTPRGGERACEDPVF